MVPLVEHDNVLVVIVVCIWFILRIKDNKRRSQSFGILGLVMRVVPVRTMLAFSGNKLGKCAIHADWTLCNPWHTVIVVCTILKEPMNVYPSLIIFQPVLYSQFEGFTALNYDGAKELTVEANGLSCKAVWSRVKLRHNKRNSF